MATEKKIAANRSNAKQSTGPKTALGKIRSSSNALRHGLSRPIQKDMLTLAKIETLANALAGQNDEQQHAVTFARSQLELNRVRIVRAGIFAGSLDSRTLRKLISLDRYELAARAKSRRAKRLLTKQQS